MGKDGFSRRDVLRFGAMGAASLALTTPMAFGQEAGVDVWAIHGTDKSALMKSAMKLIAENGGFGAGVKNITFKVNAAWTRTPEQGANTHPELVDGFIKGAKDLGVSEIIMPEHGCTPAKWAFSKSGIKQVADAANVSMIDLKTETSHFKGVEIPKAKTLKKADVAAQYIDAECIVNMPVAKHHGGATLSMAMKNWMGVVEDRRHWHREGLHQCIADFSTFIKPTWTIIDATRTMMDRGPQGPSQNVKTPNLVILSKDQVAADTYAATLFHENPLQAVKYLKMAGDIGAGVNDLERITVHKIEA